MKGAMLARRVTVSGMPEDNRPGAGVDALRAGQWSEWPTCPGSTPRWSRSSRDGG